MAGFVEQYLWVHEQWSPVTSTTALAEMEAATIAERDPTLSTAAIHDGNLAALVLAFQDDDHRLETVAETQTRQQPHGRALLAVALAHTLRAAAATGI